jgi:hypothetical protein
VEANSAMVGRAPAWDLVFTSGEYTVPHYLALGVKEAHFLPPPVETELFYPSNKSSDADLNSGCDVNFVLTNLYSQFPTSVINRTALILALAQAAEQEPFNFQVYGPEQVNVAPAHYHGGISYDKQRPLFASCRITINTHVNNGFGGRYANERDVIVPASSGLLLVDGETPSVLTAGRDCLMMESTQPEQIAKQVVHILRATTTNTGPFAGLEPELCTSSTHRPPSPPPSMHKSANILCDHFIFSELFFLIPEKYRLFSSVSVQCSAQFYPGMVVLPDHRNRVLCVLR